MIPNTLQLQHERVDDIPLLLGLIQQLHLPEILERHLGSHHLHRGLSNGWLASVWLAFIVSEANHCKVSVQDWAKSHQQTLQRFLGQPLRPAEFSDDRLSIILRRFHDMDWPSCETELWQATCQVYEIPISCVRLDSSTSYGYHTITPEGLMQFGHSTDHRPDLPQFKLMAAAAQPSGQMLSSELYPGNTADDPLYIPMIQRVRSQVGRRGLLYAGDSKMAALETRADLASHDDYYLVPLPLTGETQLEFASWVTAAVAGDQALELLYTTNDKGETILFGAGYEFERPRQAIVAGQVIEWTERVQVIRSEAQARRQDQRLEERLHKACEELRGLTPPIGRGKQQFRDEDTLRAAVTEVLRKHDVTEYLAVHWQREETRSKHYEGPGRGGRGRPYHYEVVVRYQVTEVQRQEAVIAAAKCRHGWRVQATNLPCAHYTLQICVLIYNGGWSLERDWHMLKDKPLGLQPLYVREEEQITGLIRLLTIALRLLTLFELRVRAALAEQGEELSGLYEGQPKRKTARPTGTRMLKAITRLGMTLTCITSMQEECWYVTPLPPLLARILELAGLPSDCYSRMVTNSG